MTDPMLQEQLHPRIRVRRPRFTARCTTTAAVTAAVGVLSVFAESAGAATTRGARKPIGLGAHFDARPACSCSGVRKKGIFAHPPWKDPVKGRVKGR